MDPDGPSAAPGSRAELGGGVDPGRDAAPVDYTGKLSADDLARFIYTSGTGGQPKGVMLTHGNIMANLRGVWGLLERIGLGDEVFLSFLPLSHAYEHTAGQFLPIAMARRSTTPKVPIPSRRTWSRRADHPDLRPRLYEVLRQKIVLGVERQGGARQRLFNLALALGRKTLSRGRSADPPGYPDRLLDRLVRDKVKARFGGRLKAMVSGGAPLNPEPSGCSSMRWACRCSRATGRPRPPR